MQCPRCQHKNRTQAKFCEECASPLDGATRTAPSYADLKTEVEGLRPALGEALEQQTATAEILRVISSSPTDLQPVLATVAEHAARVCGANDAQIFRVEGDVLCWAASHGPIAPYMEKRPINRGWVSGRAVVDRRTIHVRDLAAESDTEYPVAKADHRVTGHRTTLATPLLREGIPLGVIVIRRLEVLPFSEKQVRLLETFADQAVIAIENVRLFRETKEALERQTATSEILRVISSSPTNTQPVFDTIAENAARLCAARDAQVLRVEDDVLSLVSAYGSPSMPLVRAISRGHAVGRAVIDRQTIHVRDMAQAVREFPETSAPQHGVESCTSSDCDWEGPKAGQLIGTRYSRTMGASMRRHSRRRLLQGLALAGFSLLSGCERGPKVPRIGFLAVGSREGRAFLIEGFLQGLREHGYVEGRNIVIEYRFSADRNDRLPELAAELVARKVDLIVASGSPASFAAKQVTDTIPIVMGSLNADPVATGLIASLARPGGNITGITEMAPQLSGKRLQLLKETVPRISRVAVFSNPLNPAYGPILKDLEAAAQTMGMELQRLEVRVPEDFAGAFEAATRQRAGALVAPGDPLVTNR